MAIAVVALVFVIFSTCALSAVLLQHRQAINKRRIRLAIGGDNEYIAEAVRREMTTTVCSTSHPSNSTVQPSSIAKITTAHSSPESRRASQSVPAERTGQSAPAAAISSSRSAVVKSPAVKPGRDSQTVPIGRNDQSIPTGRDGQSVPMGKKRQSAPTVSISSSASAVVSSPSNVKPKPAKAAPSSASIYQTINKDTMDKENVYNLAQPTSLSARIGVGIPTTDPIPTVTTTEPAPVATTKAPPVSVKRAPTPTVEKETRSLSDYETCRQWYYQSQQKTTGSAQGTDMLRLPEKDSSVRHSSLKPKKLGLSPKHVSTPEMRRAVQPPPPPRPPPPTNDELLYEDVEVEEDTSSAQENNDEHQQNKETTSNLRGKYL